MLYFLIEGRNSAEEREGKLELKTDNLLSKYIKANIEGKIFLVILKLPFFNNTSNYDFIFVFTTQTKNTLIFNYLDLNKFFKIQCIQ